VKPTGSIRISTMPLFKMFAFWNRKHFESVTNSVNETTGPNSKKFCFSAERMGCSVAQQVEQRHLMVAVAQACCQAH
jgi:hypothetical protein